MSAHPPRRPSPRRADSAPIITAVMSFVFGWRWERIMALPSLWGSGRRPAAPPFRYLRLKLDSSSTDTEARPLLGHELESFAFFFRPEDAAQTRGGFLPVQCGAPPQSRRAEALLALCSSLNGSCLHGCGLRAGEPPTAPPFSEILLLVQLQRGGVAWNRAVSAMCGR